MFAAEKGHRDAKGKTENKTPVSQIRRNGNVASDFIFKILNKQLYRCRCDGPAY